MTSNVGFPLMSVLAEDLMAGSPDDIFDLSDEEVVNTWNLSQKTDNKNSRQNANGEEPSEEFAADLACW